MIHRMTGSAFRVVIGILLGYGNGFFLTEAGGAKITLLSVPSAIKPIDSQQRTPVTQLAGFIPVANSEDSGTLDAVQLPPTEKRYVSSLLRTYRDPHRRSLRMREGNFMPASIFPREQQRKLLGIVDYGSEIALHREYHRSTKNVILRHSPLDAGLGSTVGIEMGTKATHLMFHVPLEAYDQNGNRTLRTVPLSITELKFLQLLMDAERESYGRIIFEEVVNQEALKYIQALLEKKYIFDALDERIPESEKRSYRQLFAQMENIELKPEVVVAYMPAIDVQTGRLTTERQATGGHGYVGTLALQDALSVELPTGKTLIRTIYNGDEVSNTPNEVIVNWMVEERVPIAMITTTRTGIDKKGGLIGVEVVHGRERPQIYELAQAKTAGEETQFYEVGLDAGSKEQEWNTNTVLINYSVLIPFLRELRDMIGEDLFQQIITPDLIENTKEQNGKQFIQLEGAMGSAMLNLNGFIQTTSDPRVRQLARQHGFIDRYGAERLVYIVHVGLENRTDFSTPTKYAFMHWLYSSSDHFSINPKTWRLLNRGTNGHIPTIHHSVLQNPFYKNMEDVLRAFGHASTLRLDFLQITGKVLLKDAVLKGRVVIQSQYEGEFDLDSPEARKALGQPEQGPLQLENIVIRIDREGRVWSPYNGERHRILWGVEERVQNQL